MFWNKMIHFFFLFYLDKTVGKLAKVPHVSFMTHFEVPRHLPIVKAIRWRPGRGPHQFFLERPKIVLITLGRDKNNMKHVTCLLFRSKSSILAAHSLGSAIAWCFLQAELFGWVFLGKDMRDWELPVIFSSVGFCRLNWELFKLRNSSLPKRHERVLCMYQGDKLKETKSRHITVKN